MPSSDEIARATGLQHALSLVLPPDDPVRHVVDAALGSGDAALVAAAMDYVDRVLPDQKKAEIEIARQLRIAAGDTPPRWAFVVSVGPVGVADVSAGTIPKWTAKHAYLIDPSLPPTGTALVFFGGARGAHLPSIERVLQSVRGTMPEQTATEPHAREAIFAKARKEATR